MGLEPGDCRQALKARVWCLGILGSTVATRQHVALDAIAGAALGGATSVAYLWVLTRRGKED